MSNNEICSGPLDLPGQSASGEPYPILKIRWNDSGWGGAFFWRRFLVLRNQHLYFCMWRSCNMTIRKRKPWWEMMSHPSCNKQIYGWRARTKKKQVHILRLRPGKPPVAPWGLPQKPREVGRRCVGVPKGTPQRPKENQVWHKSSSDSEFCAQGTKYGDRRIVTGARLFLP